MIRTYAIALAALLVLLTCCGSAWAGGGVYLDDVKITNDGTVVFSDTFDDGKLDGWGNLSDTTVECSKGNKPPCAMLLNKHIFCAAGAFHDLAITTPGVIELSANVLVTPTDDQYDCRVKRCGCTMYLSLYSEKMVPGKKTPKVAAIVQQNPSEIGSRAGVESYQQNHASSRSNSLSAVITPNCWVPIMLRLNPSQRIATMYVNGQQVAKTGYDPAGLPEIRQFHICSGYGDGSKRKD